MNARRPLAILAAAGAVAASLVLAGCEPGTGGLAGGCDPNGFGPLSGCADGEVRPAAEETASGGYVVLAGLVADAGFPSRHQDDMVAIAMAESSGDLSVVSDPNSNGTRDRCAWQINDVHDFDRWRLVNDPAYCAQAARDVYDRQGLGAWTVYNTGAYRQYLGEARTAVRS